VELRDDAACRAWLLRIMINNYRDRYRREARGAHFGLPLVCQLPLPGPIERIDGTGALHAALTAMAFSFGCITWFGGAIVGTLLIYVGSVGSAEIGAAIMLTFSAGIAIPFLAAALAVSRARRLADGLAGVRPWAGFVASVVMAAFGLVLITDNFHALSDFIYPLLHLPAQL